MYAIIHQDDGGAPRYCVVVHSWKDALEEAVIQCVREGICAQEDADSARHELDSEGWFTDGTTTITILECTVRDRKAVSL